MSERHFSEFNVAYLNPVSKHPFADPFVLKYCGEYWAYSTGFWSDGHCFGILHSRDLVDWEEIGSAMAPLPGGHTCYWAPEVSYDNGRFLMYYSVGNEERMQIRVAVADGPAGPFVDRGCQLTTEEFAIDPHVFVDEDGAKYLFYATDFLSHTHIGTGIVMDRMIDWFSLAGKPRPITRARYAWQVYDPQRTSKGGARWHTVEGPSVLKRKGRYYQMFSGGNWQNISYGVSYAFSDDLAATEEWQQVSDGSKVLPILRTLPGKVVGPGHNSVVRGPDNQQWFCVYHRWADDGSARLMCIDPLDWAGQEMIVLGPSFAPQPAPNEPTLKGFSFTSPQQKLGDQWDCVSGDWEARDGEALQNALHTDAEARARIVASSFIAEASIRCLTLTNENAGIGISVQAMSETLIQVLLLPGQNCLRFSVRSREDEQLNLPPNFDPQAFQLFRIEITGLTARVQIDQGSLRWEGHLAEAAQTIGLVTRHASAAFVGFAFTAGWEDSFMGGNSNLQDLGWRVESGAWAMTGGNLQQQNPLADALIVKELPLRESVVAYEFVINARFVKVGGPKACYGICLIKGGNVQQNENKKLTFQPALSLTVQEMDNQWTFVAEAGGSARSFTLPDDFDPHKSQQFRFRQEGTMLKFNLASQPLGEVECELGLSLLGLVSRHAAVSFDMVRVTALTKP